MLSPFIDSSISNNQSLLEFIDISNSSCMVRVLHATLNIVKR